MKLIRVPTGAFAPSPVAEHIGASFKRARETEGLSRSQLGESIGVSHNQIAKFEMGLNGISLARAKSIANLLGITLDELLRSADSVPHETSQTADAAEETAECVRLFETLSSEKRLHVLEIMRAVAAETSRVTDGS